MEFMKQKWSSGLVMGLVFTALVIGGCAKGSRSVSVTDPTAATLQPRGTVQGTVLDSVTQEPIVNAVVSIGVGTGTTDSLGQYVIADVPATYDALNGTWTDHYDMTIDLRNVTSPVKMNVSTTTPRYPNFDYSTVQVGFTSLNDANPCSDGTNPDTSSEGNVTHICGTNNTNHDTPVTGLVANQDMTVGKLDANISGAVYGGCESSDNPDYYVAKAGYTVNLLTGYSGSDNSTTGATGHLVGTTTTDPNGVFTFNNVEANQFFKFQIMDSVTNPTVGVGIPNTDANGTWTIQALSDGLTNTRYLEFSNAIHVCTVNSDGPAITSLSVEPGADLTPSATQAVTFAFNAPIDTASPIASTDPSNVSGLVSQGYLFVAYDGSKQNIPFTAAWNGAGDQLTVTFATAISSLYEVYFDVSNLTDTAGRSASIGVCPNDAPGPWEGVGGGGDDCDAYFSTNGSPTPGTPVLNLVNAASLDEAGSTTAIYDWPVVSGAKSYNFYCSADERFPDGTIVPGTVFQFFGPYGYYGDALTTSNLTFDFPGFVESDLPGFLQPSAGGSAEIGIQYTCYTTGVNADNVEGLPSNADQIAKDKLGPVMLEFSSTVYDDDSDGNADHVVVYFDEPLDKATANVPGNYTFADDTGTAPTVTVAVVCTDTDFPVTDCQAPFFGETAVLLTISQTQTTGGIQNNAGDTLTVSGVKDVNLNTIRTSGDVYNMFTGLVN